MRRLRLAMFLVICLGVGAIAPALAAEVKPPVAGEKDIEILVPGGYYAEFLKSGPIPEFEKSHPGTKVIILHNLDDAQLAARIAANNAPDIRVGGFGYDLAKYAQMGVLIRLDRLPGAGKLLNRIDPKFSRKVFGGVFGVPWTVITQVLVYNKELFREAGLDPNRPPETFDEYLAYAEKISKLPPRANGDKVYGNVFWNEALSWGGWYWGMLHQIYLNFNDGKYGLLNKYGTDVVFDHPNARMAEFFAFCQKAQKFAPPNMEKSFFNRNMGMWIQFGSGWKANMKEARDRPMVIGDDVAIAPIPTRKKGGRHWTTLDGRSLAIFKTTPVKQQLAWDFINLLLRKDNSLALYKATGDLPPLKELAADPALQVPDAKTFLASVANSQMSEPWAVVGDVGNVLLKQYMECVIKGNITPAEAVRRAAEEARNILRNKK
ncbi:MAG: extracellular solute-binding protein [Bacteroidota bacterium]